AATTHGAAMVLPAQNFSAGQTLATVEKYQCTSLYGVPTMFIAELALDSFSDFGLSSLRTGIMAGSPCPDAVMREVIHTMSIEGGSISHSMAETSCVAT